MHSYTLTNDVALVQLDDGKANAVGHTLLDHLESSLDKAEKEAQALVIAGRNGVFSGGFDLQEFRKGPTATTSLVTRGERLKARLFALPLPVVAACSGHAIAAGGFLLLTCDTRIGMAGDFKIGLNETAIGMTLPEFGLILAQARLATAYRTRALVQAELFTPEQAVSAGFLDRVVAPGALLEDAINTAAALGAMPSKAYAANKLATRRAAIAALSAAR